MIDDTVKPVKSMSDRELIKYMYHVMENDGIPVGSIIEALNRLLSERIVRDEDQKRRRRE